MDCYDHDPSRLHPIAFFASMLTGADDVAERGLDAYERASFAVRKWGLRDFDPYLVDASMDAATRARKTKQVTDVIRLFGHFEGDFTEGAKSRLVSELWHGGGVDKFTPTLGEMYVLREVQRGAHARAVKAAAKLGVDASEGFLYLTQVPHVPGLRRVYDGVVVRRRAGDTPSNYLSLRDEDVVMRIESKWYLEASVDNADVIDQIMSDFTQSVLRRLDFVDLYYGIPDTRPDLGAELQDVLLRTFDDDFAYVLKASGYHHSTIRRLRRALDDHIASGDMIIPAPEIAD